MKSFARILSVFLSMLMVLYVIPTEVYSIETTATELTTDKIEATDEVLSTETTEVTALGEDISKRTASSKTIRMSDGSYRLVQYANEVHYEDDGEWVEYDNSLSLSASKNTSLSSGSGKETPVYSTASNPSGLKFGQSASNKIVSFSEGNKKLEMNVVSANKNSNIVLESNRAEITPADKLEEIITIENYSSTVTYSNVFANAHIRYTAAGNRVKEDIIVFKKADSYSYSFNFTLTGLNAELQVDGSIVFTDEATDKMMYYIPVGYMYDSEGATSSAVSYSLTETATGCTVTVTADAGWINAADRAFPIVIDPTIIRDNGNLYAYNEIRDVHAYDGQTGVLPYQSQYINVGSFEGHDYKGYISLYAGENEEKVGFVLPEASVITEAKLVLDVMNYAPNTMVNLHAITDDWNHQTTNWVAPQVANTITDYKIINSQDLYQFDFTSVAQAWCDPQNTATSFYKGLRLSCNGTGYVQFASINKTAELGDATAPYFIISYRDTKGLDGRWTYNSQSAGGAGAGAVNLFTGNLVFVHDDITTNGEILPLTVSHVYNGYLSGHQFTATDNIIHTADYSAMNVGNGFKLSIQETVTEKFIYNRVWYIYNDADGTELYFFHDAETGKYISEDGLDLTIVKNANGFYTMSDKVGNTKKFDNKGRLYEQTDLFGNKKTITYSSNGRITNVKHTTATNSTATQLTFTYNSAGALIRIENAQDTSEFITFAYSATWNGTVNQTNAGFLRAVTYSKGAGSCSYEYFETGKLKYAIDALSGNKLVYQYSSGKVASVSEYNASSALGQKISFIYGNETTAVRTSGKDDAHGTADDLLTHYVFDDHGRTISAYSTDLAKTEVYGASNAEYSPTVQGSKKNNTITKDSVSGVPAINLITNHSMENSGSWNGYYSGTGYSSAKSTTKAFAGNNSYKLTSTSTKDSGFAERRQNVTLTDGTYTLSAYVRVESITANTGFYLMLGDHSSRKIKEPTISYTQNGWQRISVTAYLEEGTHQVRLLLQKAIGTVYVDCVQLEKSDGVSKYNRIENGAFNGASGWTLSSDASAQNEELVLSGNALSTVTATQTVAVNLPLTTTFVLSGWAKASSVAITDNDRYFGMKATLIYSDNSSEETTVNFCAENAAWQFASGAVVNRAKTGNLTIKSVKIELHYDYNANTASFDNICLAIEPAQTYLYDDDGNLMSATNAEGNKIDAEYAANGVDILSYTNIVGESYNFAYSTEIPHLLTSITKCYNGDKYLQTLYEYDSYGNLKKQTDRDMFSTSSLDSITTQSSYDSYGRVQSVTDSLEHTTSYNRNSATELLNYVQDANGGRTAYLYTDNELLETVFNDKDKDGVADTGEEKVEYTYNSKNQLTSIETDSTTYNLSYDSFGNLSTVKAGTNTLASYTYNSRNGKLSTTTYGNGFTVSNIYDKLDRLVEAKYNNAVAYTVSYNGDGGVSKIVDAKSGITTEYEYDSLGRLVTATERETSTNTAVLGTYNFFDSYGRPILSAYTLPSQHLYYTVGYLPNSSLISRYTATDSTNTLTRTYTYDGLQRVTSVSTEFNDSGTLQESYTYVSDANSTSGLVASYTVGNTSYNYLYDALGNITRIYENGALRRAYTYDSLGQLISESVYPATGSVQQYQYSYDKSGNITNVQYNSDSTTQNKTYTYGNENWGDLLTNYNGTSISYDAIGNPTNWRNANQLLWQGRNLVLLQHPDGTHTGYLYNADGIRTQKLSINEETTVAEVAAKYTLDGNKIVAEQRGDITLYYLYDDTGAIMGISYGTSTYTFAKNIQGDVIGIYSGGGLVAKYEYDAYGKILSITDEDGDNIPANANSIANLNPFRYRGYYYDTETGFYYVSSRYYDPEIGRWISPEPNVDYGEFDEGAGLIGYNVYAYCANNPVNYYDPTGEFVISTLLICVAAGAIIGGTIGGIAGNAYANSKGYTGWDKAKAILTGIGIGGLAGGALGYFAAPAVVSATGVAGISITSGGISTIAALGTSFGKLGTLIANNGQQIIDWGKTTWHGMQRMIERGVTQNMVEVWAKTGKALQQAGDKILYITKQGAVVIDKAGKVITAYTSQYFDPAMQEVVEKLFGK